MRTVLSIDPSGVPNGQTGIVLLGYDDETRAFLIGSWAVTGGVNGFRSWLNEFLPSYPHRQLTPWNGWHDLSVDTVVVEQFIDRQIRGADRSPLLVEGIVRFLWPDAVLSPASGYKQAVPDDVLKRLGLWFTGDHHADRNSAARHAVRWLKNQKHVPTLDSGWPRG